MAAKNIFSAISKTLGGHFGEHTEARTPKRPVTGPSPEKNGGAGELSTAL